MDIIRPTLLLDKEVCLQNIARMAQKTKAKGLIFRPHFKTHQSAGIGNWFRDYGVTAITVSSVSMAQYFAQNGWDDITIAFPVNIYEVDAINALAKNIRLNLLIENLESVQMLTHKISQEVGVFIEIDTGHNRTGIAPNKFHGINAMLDVIKANQKFQFKGFLSHTGHTYQAQSKQDIYNRHFDALLKMRALKNYYLKDFPDLILSLGDTPSAALCENFNGIDELRPGNFVFFDLMQYKLGACNFNDIALRLVCPVISRHGSRSEVIIYGGAAHISKDSIINLDGKSLYGQVVINKNGKKTLLDERNYLYKLSQEHGVIRTTLQEFHNFAVGDLVEIIPAHSCLTANLMGEYLTTEGEWIPMMSKDFHRSASSPVPE
ncbi:alanine racemase [Mangrovibacterium marinum]|uniref:D-serine deaminase-like pyridoxal phosphate-dependent protein n=1 Tax=Mangrovibacterium marinum TaxID=1639118 RepID=A0A2T5C601_9BACT|nr:alanine racemase [Mangrovibacterium marinum]PTN10288.1 D-serine deaminase-like pyridoxal phosphate-dependent protein [Mangrovibacterium marinum]